MTYEEWEERQHLSPSSPEAYYAEAAWNAALREVHKLVMAAGSAENTVAGIVSLLDSEIKGLIP